LESPLRALLRLLAYAAATLVALPVQIVALRLGGSAWCRLPVAYHRWCCRIMGFRVVVHGTMEPSRPTLFVANHCSYSDVTVLGSVIAGSFIAKAEVASWPIYGFLARLQRTVFVDRLGRRALEQRDGMIGRLEAGDNLIMFPEGTSNDGNRVLPFKSALFSVAQHRFENVGGLKIQPVSIAYTRLDGMPMGRALKPYFSWYGDMELASHMWALAGLGMVTVEIVFHPPVVMSAFGSRKALAEHCHATVAAGVAAANSGWPAELPPNAAAGLA